jgi:hypothetical protein
MGAEIEDTGEIVFEDSGEARVEPVPPELRAALLGLGRLPKVMRRMGHLFRLRRQEVVSRSGERTHVRLTYRREDT